MPVQTRRKKLVTIRRKILDWYETGGRALPWRTMRDPYRVWISEVMLQQTQVSRVKEYYRRFLKRFPTLESLAAARWSEVLPLWRGLGYYQRGRNVLAAAKAVARDHRGKLPQTYDELRGLPGIGHYTANAVLSFAFGKPVAAFDTNMRRVLTRVFDDDSTAPDKIADELFAGRLKHGATLNHALMDIGAMFCSSRAPRCAECPVNSCCTFAKLSLRGAKRRSNLLLYPPKTSESRLLRRFAPRNDKAIDVGAACIHKNGKYLLAKRPRSRGGEWEFPGGKRMPGEDIRRCLKREIAEELGVEVSVRPAFYTEDFRKDGKLHRLHFCRCQILRGVPKASEHDELRWVEKEKLHRMPIAETNQGAAKRLSIRPAGKA